MAARRHAPAPPAAVRPRAAARATAAGRGTFLLSGRSSGNEAGFGPPRPLVKQESGFTLIELLVVILIIGILAVIALPAFLGQRAKGQDSDAKSNARNLLSEVESCFTESDLYSNCTDSSGLGDTGLPLVPAPPPSKS